MNKSFVARYTAAIVHPAPAVIARPLHDGYHSHDVCDLMLTPCLIWRRSVLFQASQRIGKCRDHALAWYARSDRSIGGDEGIDWRSGSQAVNCQWSKIQTNLHQTIFIKHVNINHSKPPYPIACEKSNRATPSKVERKVESRKQRRNVLVVILLIAKTMSMTGQASRRTCTITIWRYQYLKSNQTVSLVNQIKPD